MSSGEQPSGPETVTAPKITSASNPATWGLIGVLCGSLVSGAFSYVSARMAYEASENAATKAQQTSERALEAERNQARDEFIRSQRVTVYGKYLSASQVSERAAFDFLYVLQNPTQYTVETAEYWRGDFEGKYREFIDAGWSVEFFAPADLKAVVHELNAELEARHNMLSAHYVSPPTSEQLQTLIARMPGGAGDKVYQLRTKFTEVAGAALTS